MTIPKVDKGESVAFDSTALEAKIAGPLAAIDDASETVAEVEVEVEETEAEADAVAPDASVEDETPESDPSETSPDDPEAVEEAEGGKPDSPIAPKLPTSPTLPAAYRRTLRAYEWTDEEIDAAYGVDPANFTITASKLHRTRNDEIAAWARMGRAARDTTAPDTGAEGEADGRPSSARKSAPATKGPVPRIDVEGLSERYGDPDLIKEIAGPINAAIDAINGYLPDITSGVAAVQQGRVAQLQQIIDGFFADPEIQPYADLYGAGKDLTKEQLEARGRVLETADALVVGARQQGRSLTVQEAIALAHDSVSADHKTAAIRKELRGTVTKRAESVTMKPTRRSGKGAAEDDSANSSEGLETRIGRRLAKLNW